MITSSSLRAIIRGPILTDIKTANQRSNNHKLKRAVQAMLFGMVWGPEQAEDEPEHKCRGSVE
jgi:hypothetical protein